MKLPTLKNPSFNDWAGAALVLLSVVGLIALIANLGFEEQLMSLNAALCFMAAGAAFLLQSHKRHHRFQVALGGLILLLVSPNVIGIFFNIFSTGAKSFVPISYLHDPSLNNSLAFVLVGLILVLMHDVRTKWAANLLQLLSVAVILVGVLDLIDGFFDLETLLYQLYGYRALSTVSGIAVLLLGINLYSLIQRTDWCEKFGLNRQDRKITIISATILLAIAFFGGLVIFALMAQEMEEVSKKSLAIMLESRVKLFNDAIDNAIDSAILSSRRQRLNALVDKVSTGAGTPAEYKAIENIADRTKSWGYISAIAIYDANGKKITQRGKFLTDPEFKVSLRSKQKATLLWRGGFILNVKIDNTESDKRVASFNIDVPLPKVDALFTEITGLGKGGSLLLCAPYDSENIMCPQTPGRTRTGLGTRYVDGILSPMARAVDGETGVMSAVGRSGKETISAYAPAGSLGLGMMIKIRKAQMFHPIQARFERTLLLLLVSVVIGVILLRWQIVPLVRQLVNEISERKRAQEESGLQQAISQEVGKAKDIHAALEIVLRNVCKVTGWKVGQAWIPRADGAALECSPAWHTCITGVEKFRLLNQALVFEPNRGLAGRVWYSKTPEWMRNVTVSKRETLRQKTSRRTAVFQETGLIMGTGIPILAGNEVVAVLEFFTSELHEEDARLVALISSVAAQLGVVIQRERAQMALDVTEERYRTLIHNCVEVIYLYDPETKQVLEANPAFLNLLGYTAEEVRTLSMYDFIAHNKESIGSFSRELKTTGAVAIGERIWRSKDGRQITMDVTAGRLWKGDKSIGFTVARDITAQKQAEERLNYLAHYDELTGLPNRVLFNDHLKQAMIEAASRERLVALMFLDLDRFKTINDTLGHETGDALLKAVAERLKDCLRRGDIVSRLGGDEFTLVLADMGHIDDVTRLAKKILDGFSLPFRIGERDLFITPSIGITLYPFDQDDINSLLKNADAAMYRAKEQGRNNYQFYTSEMNVRALERLSFETGLRQALERNEFVLHYQPQVDLVTGNITGMEALVRWQNPELGLVSPAQFIPLAEETGLIVAIGEWVIRTACKQNKAWQAAGLPPLRVSVNLSARQFKEKNLVERVAQVLKETGLDARYLELELTESLLQYPEATITPLKELHALGVHLSIDDFGTGYSSLSYLKRFPINAIKIDRSFVRDITTDADDAAIANAIITMAHSLGMHVVAEGVETGEQLAFLCQRKCDSMQGFYFSKPLPADVFADLIKDGRRLTPSQRRISPEMKVISA